MPLMSLKTIWAILNWSSEMATKKKSLQDKWWEDVKGWLIDLNQTDRQGIVNVIKHIEAENKKWKKAIKE